MNVQDVEDFVVPENDHEKLKLIFARQLELIEKYHHIEARNGFHVGEGHPLDLNNRHDQHRLKDFAWRTMEEISEAFEAEELHQDTSDHSREEFIDALHFLVELVILSGLDVDQLLLTDEYNSYRPEYMFKVFFTHIGCAMNCLKNKPWKVTHMLTDETKFKHHLYCAWEAYMKFLASKGFTTTEIFQMYFKKSEVNKFRQDSGY